jgi:hypothetical protein
MSLDQTFEIHVYFTVSNGEPMIETCKLCDLKKSIERLMYGPFATMGGIKSFKVIDNGDCVVFSVLDGKVIFPSANQLDSN